MALLFTSAFAVSIWRWIEFDNQIVKHSKSPIAVGVTERIAQYSRLSYRRSEQFAEIDE